MIDLIANRLNYCWRLIATAISFFVFGFGGLVLALVVFPLLNLFIRNKKQRKRLARIVIQKGFRFFVKMMGLFGMFDFDLKDVEHKLKNTQGKIVIANHPSLIDVVVLISIIPHADCIVKTKLWSNPFMSGVLKAVDYIKNNQDIEALLNACKQSLSEGYLIIIFPEGTRTKPGMPIKLQRGASNIAIRCGSDILPITICCNPTTLTKSEPWYSIPASRSKFSLSLGTVIKSQSYVHAENAHSLSARQLTNDIQHYFSEETQNHA